MVHPVGPLEVDEGGRVLADLAPGAGDAAAARVLAGRLGGLPLALHQAGSYLASPFAMEQTFTAYGQALAERFGVLLGRGNYDRARVTSTWELSLDALAAQGLGQVRALLRVVSCFADGVPVPPVLLGLVVLGRCCGGQAEAEDGLSGLLAVGLIETLDPGPRGWRRPVLVHPLVAETIRLQAADALAESFAVAVDLLGAATRCLNEQDLRDQPVWIALLPHLRALLDLNVAASAAVLAALAKSAARISTALVWGGSYRASLEITEAGLRRVAGLGGEHEQTLALRFQQAYARRFLGQAAEAETQYRQVLDAQRRVLCPDHPDTLTTRHNIGRVLADQGRTADAEREYQQVLDARLRVLGSDHPDTLMTRHEVARMLAAQGKPAEAEAEYQQVLGAEMRVLGPDHPTTLATRHRIASVVADQGKAADAETEYRQVLDAKRWVLGADHPSTLATRHRIASVLADQGKAADGETE